ncbi:MAG: hypothetical protein ACLQVA_13930 [Candidatus Brocadiia bacterium]
MTGTIYRINPQRGMVAILTETDGFSVFELLSEIPLEIGDEVKWEPDTSCGRTHLVNITKHRTDEVYFQNHWVSAEQLRQQLLLNP